MHFDAAPALIALALATATTSAPIQGRRPYTYPGLVPALPGIRRTQAASMACLIV